MVMTMSSGSTAGSIGASRRIAPKTKSSEPEKFAVSAISSVLRPVTKVSSARAGEARTRARTSARSTAQFLPKE